MKPLGLRRWDADPMRLTAHQKFALRHALPDLSFEDHPAGFTVMVYGFRGTYVHQGPLRIRLVVGLDPRGILRSQPWDISNSLDEWAEWKVVPRPLHDNLARHLEPKRAVA